MQEARFPDFDRIHCPINIGNEILGDKWTILILRELFLGFHRFETFEKNLGISRSVLSAKLKKLVDNEVLETFEYRDSGQRTRSEYHLTRKGKHLLYLMVSLLEWGNMYPVASDQEKLHVVDSHGDPVRLAFVNSKGESIRFRDLRFTLNN